MWPPADAAPAVLTAGPESCCEGFLGEAELVRDKKSFHFNLEGVVQVLPEISSVG